MTKKLVVGNWKMNGLSSDLTEIEKLLSDLRHPYCDVVICPPATVIHRMHDMTIGTGLYVGGQDCHAAVLGAHTGDLSAAMLVDAGATHVILGHSERRADHSETDQQIQAKAVAALQSGLTAIVCIGETEVERDADATLKVVRKQLRGSLPEIGVATHIVVAYKPVWAIGTGRTPTPDQIVEVHAFMRSELTERFGDAGAAIRLLYGGSVKPDNADVISSLENVDGALVGGASLQAADFSGIIGSFVA